MQNNDKTQKNLSGLHNTLEEMGYSVPSIDQFAKDMRKEDNLRSVYDKVSSGGYELPDFETFKADMGWIKPTPAGVPTPLRPKDQLAPTGKPGVPAAPFGFDLPANPKKPSHAPKARLGFPRLDKKMRPVQEVNAPSVPLLKTTRDVAQDENGNVVNVVQPELVPDFDPNNGGVTAPKALMDVTTGKTIRPTELSKEEVDGYNAGNIDAVKDPKLRQALKEANIIYTPDVDMDKVHRGQVRDLEQEIDADLKTAYDSFTDKAAAKAKDTRNLVRFGLATAGASMGGGATTMGMHANPLAVESDPEIYMLKLAKHNIQDAKNYIAEADHNAQEGTFSKWLESSFAGGAARGFAQKLFDARTWDMGIGDAGEASSIKAAVNKADLGEKLTPAEDKLLQSMVTKMAVEAYFNSQVGRGYTAGSVSAYSIPFMLEMAANPVSTSGNAIGAKLMRYAVRKFGLNVAGKALRNKAVKAAVKYGVGGLTSAAVSSAALTATSGTAHVAADAVSRNTGDLKFDYKADPETGELRAKYSGHEEGDDALTATGKAFFMRFMENFSEYSGEALAPIAAGVAKGVGAGAKAAGKAVASRMGKAGAKILDAGRWGTKAARELIDNISASEFGRTITALEKKAHYNGKVLEFAEEKISDLASVLIGDKDLSTDKGKGFFNLDDNIDTFLGVSLTGGVISAAQTAGYFAGGGARGMARYQIGQSEGAVWSTLTTDEQRKAWDDVRRQILLQDGKEQVDAVKSALTNPNFNAEQRRAILDYTKSVQTYKGMSEYRRKQSEDTKADPLQNELADSYDKGAGMTEAEEMSHARSWYEFAQQKAAERLGVDAEALDEMGTPDQLTLDQVAQLREEHNEQAVQSYVDYLNARATYEGMIGSVSQGIQAEAAQAEQAVRSQQHKDGTLRRATLRGTEGQNVEVHIKDGDLVMDEEGRIDTDKSSKDFIVRDNETGVVRFASIDDIISAEQPTSADDAVSEAVNAVYERREKEAADAINGTITPQVGAVYDLLDADGNPQQIAIRQVGQDGTLDVDYSGVPHKMTTDELQTMADNTRARQIENEHAAQVQQAKAEEREEREQAGLPRYALNDELTIRTPEGEEVTAYVTNEEDADGNIEVYFNEPFDGKKVHLFTKDYLDGVVVGTRLSPETNTSAGTVEAPATAAAPTQEEENDIIGRSMTEEEAEAFLTAISNNHEVAPELELTPENWYAEFGEDGMVHTPIGDAHMGENQFLKMMRDGRKSKLGMIRPTLEAPHAIVEEPSTAKEGQETERDSSYIYIRVFEKEDGSRHYHFTSVSVQRDGGEVIVSNQEKSRNQVKRLLTEGVVLWMRADNAPDTSDVDQDLYSSQGTELSDPASEGTDASQSTPSESKDNERTSHADPNDESLSPEEAYEAVLRATNGDVSLALEVIESTIADKEKALAKAKKAKPRSASTIDGKIQALAEVASGIEAAEASLAHWQAVGEIAAEQVQEEAGEVAEPVAEQTEQESEEPTTEQAPAEEETTEEQEPEAEQEEEATTIPEDTAPEWGKDNPADARARGYIKVEGLRVERQGKLSDALIGKESDVKFATNDTQQARYAIIEAESLQPSHIRGYQNQLHFIPEAQPKDRSDVVSEQAAVRIAANINPEEITTSATAYTGAPTINARGEVIQGNSRADALRAVWESFRDTSGAKYKQYLIENAEDLGIDPEAIEGMKSPVLVHLADVSDERAIELGQYRQSDIESGGVERINPQTLYAKIGEKRDTFIRFLLGTSDDDLSLAESITRNAAETLSWLNRQGFISDTQFRSAFGSKGEITAEAKEDLRNTLYRSFFEGAHNSLEAEFYNLPKRTQQALLRVSYRDQQSPADAHFLDELQSSVSAYNALMGYAPFAEAKTFEDAERAIETWMRFSGDLITGEVNSEQYSNFAVQLALRYKFYTQKELIAKLNAVYDAVQAVSEDTLFGEGEVKPKTLAEAVREVFSIKYDNKTEEDGSIGSSSTGGNSQGSNGGEQEGQGTPGGNEQDQSRAGTPERRGGTASDPQGGEGVTTQTEEVAPEAGDTQASDTTGEGYRLSAIAAKRGGNFFENNEGSIDLVKISDNVFEAIGIKPLPMRMTEAMAQHIIKQHAKELGISTQEEAVAFVVDIMQHFDHVREGNKPNTYIFSIEKGRSRTGKRAVTLVLPSKSGEYLGVSSSGYEKVSRLKERALLWEEGANNEAPTTETASANVTSPSATQGGMTGGSASNQSNALSQGKDSEKNTAEGGANNGNQDDLSIEEKEALLSKAKQELVEKEDERTAVAEQAIAIMKDYYDSGAIPGMDSGEFHGQATLILIGFKDRSNLELMKAPGLSELLPSLYKLADEARAKKMLVRKYEKELSQAKEVEGETLTHDKAIRDELVNTMRDAGIEVITDEAEGQAVLDAVHAGEAQMQRAYHGTDADFEAFDHSHMGEGAGGQAYGWGSYFTEAEGVARSYAGGGFVYEAELPDDTGSNYLHFESKPSNKDIARVKRELVEYILRKDEEGLYDYPQGKDDLTQEVDDAGEPTTWRDLYGTASSHLGSDKEASAFFHSIGYVGIQYNSSEADGGKKNLVIFDESDISIQSKVRLFKTSSGEVYGFVKDGKIYLDLKHATAETAIHEYTHLWASALRRVNPRAWKSIRKQLKGFELWADIASRYPELKGDEDALADEVLAQYSGKRGAQRIEEEMKKAENATDLVGKARVLAAFNSLKEALKTFWTEVADFFGMDYYKSVEDAADKAISDLLRGVNPNAVEAKKETTKKKPTKKATAKKETATSSVIAPDSERYNGYIVTLPKSGKAGAEVGNIEEFVGADEMREGLMVVYQAPEGFAVASNGTMAIADKTQFDVYKKGKAYKLDGTTIDAGAWKPLKDKWQSFVSTETRGENSDPFTESPVNIPRLSKYLDRVEQDLYNRWKYAKSEGLTKDSFKTYRGRAMVSIPNGRGGYVSYPYTDLRTISLAAKRLGVTSFFVEGDLHFGSSVQPGRRIVGNGRLGSVVHAGYFETRDPNASKRKELSYLYDEAVGVKDADEGVRMQKGNPVLTETEKHMRPVSSATDSKLAVTTLSPSTELPMITQEKRDVSVAEAKQAITDLPKQVETLDGYTLNIGRKTKNKLGSKLSQNISSSEYKQALTLIPQIVGNSVLVEEHRDRTKAADERKADNHSDSNIEKVQRFYGAIVIGEITYRVKTTAIVAANTEQGTRMHNYDITEIELLQSRTSQEAKSPAQRSNSISLAKLMQGAEFSYGSGKSLLSEMTGSDTLDDGVRYRSSRLSPELQAIKDQAKADGNFMKAPNGRPTNLTEKQWLQVRTPEFKEWFGDWENDPTNASKVVDENGEPMVVYHGTSVSSRRFFKFKDGAPNWFTPSEYYAKAFTFDEDIPVMYPTFIKIKKLLYLGYIDGDVISGKIRSLSLDTGISESSIRYIVSKERADKVYQITNSPLFKGEAMALGYDGMMALEAGVDSFAIFSPSQVKSATENTGSFDGMNDDIRYAFIGKRGASMLDKSEEASTRLDNLSIARQMEAKGKSEKAIKMATGWERGADGLWRYEIQDAKLVDLSRLEVGVTYRLPDVIIGGEEILSAYPSIGEYTFLLEDMDPRTSGYFDPSQKHISLNSLFKSGKTKKDPNDTFVHELQHLIQEIEGFETGSDPDFIKKSWSDMIKTIESVEYANELEGKIRRLSDILNDLEGADRNTLQDMQLLSELRSMAAEFDSESLDWAFSEWEAGALPKHIAVKAVKSLKDRFEFNWSVSNPYSMLSEEEADHLKRIVRDHSERRKGLANRLRLSPFYAGYRRVAGEVEARNVSARMGMTPEERRSLLARETEDVSREDTIFFDSYLNMYSEGRPDNFMQARSDRESDMTIAASNLASSLGEDLIIVRTYEELEKLLGNDRASQARGAKGFYLTKQGKVALILDNNVDVTDALETVLHEIVGHKGLQELVGKDQFGKFLDEVFEGANEAVRNGIVERSKRYGWNTRLATEEYIAELAEQGFKDLEARDLWNVVRNAFYNLLSRVKLALGWDISDRELRYMLWRTYQMKKGEGLMGQAKDIAMQEKLGVGNYEEARFRQGEIAPVKVAATYDALIQKSSYQTQEAFQDSMLSLKKAMEMIMQAKGDAKYIEEIEGYQNAYMGENRVSSVNQAEAAAYSRMALEPLVEEVSRLAKKAHHSYVTDYMMAKHGLERNRVMAFQKAVEADVDAHNKAVKESGEGEELTASSLWDAYLNDTDRIGNEADYRNGLITADVWHKTDDEIRARYAPSYAEYRERDYAGLTGLLDRPDVDIQTLEEEAIEEVMKFEDENDVTDLWDLTNKATDAPLSKQYEGGLMSRETLEHVRNMYGYYIPLRGFDETTSDEAYSYLGDRDRAFSPTLKKAKGRSSKAEDPLAHIASMMESAILQSNRNKLVRQKFLNFVENNPSDLFSVQKLWVKWNEVTKAWEAVLPEFDPNDTSEEVIRKTQEFEEMMRENKRKDPKNFKLASEQPSIPYRVVGQDKKMQHQIIVKRGGRDVVIIVNGDPRVAMAVNGLTNPDGNVGGHIGAAFKAAAAVNRKLAGFYTSLSPNFVVKNFIRDIIYANTIVWVKESPSYALRYHKNVGKLAGQMHRLVYLYDHDKLDMSNETHRAFKLFMENGGETGYSQLRSMDLHKKEIERMMKESGGRISLKQALRLLGETVEFANRGIEDLSRFAAFLTSRQMGRTIDRSIYDAKEMTVNFNKKGAGSTLLESKTQDGWGKSAAFISGMGRSLYLFWNVSIQGSVNIARAVKRNPKKGTAYLATFLALGILQTMLPALTGGDDDDRYWNLPDYVRRNNICFFVGDVLVKIPLPQEARAIFGIGELGMSYMSGKEDKDAWMVAYTIAGQLSQIMPLDLMDDSGPIHALMPSLAKPFFEAQTNHSWMGRPIWKDTDYNKAMPDWTKAYKSTGGVYVWLAKELNALTGGDDYKQGWVNINPAKLEYMLKGYLGGLYTAADQIIKSSETAFGDREFSMRDVPILSGFLDGADERNDMRNVNNTYYHFKEEAKEVLRLGKSYESDLEQGKSDSTDYAKKLDELVNTKSYERALLFEDLSKEIEEMQKALKDATDPKEAEELQAEIDKQKKALVIQLRQMK